MNRKFNLKLCKRFKYIYLICPGSIWAVKLHWLDILLYNYTLYKNPGFWLVNNRCIFRVFSYLGLICSFLPLPGYLHEDLTFFPLCRGICENVFHFFTLARLKPPNSFEILQPLSDITNRNTTTVPAEGNSSKRPIVFNNCQVTNNKNRIFLKTTNKRYYLFSQFSK